MLLKITTKVVSVCEIKEPKDIGSHLAICRSSYCWNPLTASLPSDTQLHSSSQSPKTVDLAFRKPYFSDIFIWNRMSIPETSHVNRFQSPWPTTIYPIFKDSYSVIAESFILKLSLFATLLTKMRFLIFSSLVYLETLVSFSILN